MGYRLRSRALLLALVTSSAAVTLGLPSAIPQTPAGAADAGPTVSIGAASVVAAAVGQPTITFPVTLSSPASHTVTVSYTTRGGSARVGRAFRAASGVVRFPYNRKTHTMPLTEFASAVVNPTSKAGGSTTFTMTLSNAVGATIAHATGVGTIYGRATGPGIRVSAGDMHVYDGTNGGSRFALARVTLSRPAPKAIGVHYTIVGVSAVKGTNYLPPTSGVLKIGAGGVGAWVLVRVVPGSVHKSAKTFRFKVTKAAGATIARANGTLTILPEESAPPVTEPPPPTGTIFDDEFNGTSLDTSKWQPNWLGNNNSTITPPINGSEASCYDPAQVSEPGDGYLHLNATSRSCRASNGRSYQYASGLVETKPHFTFTYGYLEARIFLPASGSRTANWPALWADGTGNWPSTGELDVMEGLNGSDCYHFHSNSGGPGGCASFSQPSGWHTFGARWAPGSVTFFYDGNQVGSISSGITGAPMYLILNFAVGGAGGPISVPSTMLVDWIRVTK